MTRICTWRLNSIAPPADHDLWPPCRSWDLVLLSSLCSFFLQEPQETSSCDPVVYASVERPITIVTWQVSTGTDATMWALFSNKIQLPPEAHKCVTQDRKCRKMHVFSGSIHISESPQTEKNWLGEMYRCFSLVQIWVTGGTSEECNVSHKQAKRSLDYEL